MNSDIKEKWDALENARDALEAEVTRLQPKGKEEQDTLILAQYKLSRIEAMMESLSTEIGEIIG